MTRTDTLGGLSGGLDLAASEIRRARAGSGRMTLLRGATGTGRSTLLEAIVEIGATHRMRVLRARCSTEDSRTEFAAVTQLLDCVGDTSDPDLPARAWRLLRSYAADSPLLLAVDDVHLADHASRRWLTQAARRLDRSAIMIVATERSQYDIALPAPGLAHVLPPAVVRVHTLSPLSRTAAESLVRDRLGHRVPDLWVDGYVRAGASNPMLLQALLDDQSLLAPDRIATAELPESCADLYPGAFAASVAWWLESAGPATAATARALADLEAEEYSGCLLAEAAGADPARVSGWVTAMIRLGFLRGNPAHGRVRFAHPLLRDAVLDRWPRPDRQAVHARIAAFRHRRGDPAEAVADHLLRTTPQKTEWAVDALLDAATAAARAGRTADATDHLRRALDEPMNRERKAEVLTELGSLEFALAPGAGIPRLAEAMRLQDIPRARVQAAVTLGSALARRGETRAAFTLLDDLDRDLGEAPGLGHTVRAALVLLSDHDQETRITTYTSLRDTAVRSPVQVGPAEQALLTRYEATAGQLSADQARRRIRVLLSAPEDPLLMPYLLGTAAAVAQWADTLDDAERLVRRGLAERALSPLHPMRQALLDVRLDIAVARGRYADVLASLQNEEAAADRATPDGPGNVHAQCLLALVESGRLAEAERLAEAVTVHPAHDSWELNRFLYARGMLRFASGDLEAAVQDFLECGRRQTAREVLSPVVTPWRSAAAECLLALGSRQEALPLAEEEYRLAAVWNTPRVLGRALRVLGEASDGRRGQELTARAVEILRGACLDTEAVAALISQGRQFSATGQRGRARTLLREAAVTAERLGAVRLLALARKTLRECGARPRGAHFTGVGALTDGEHRVARLAVAGHTNAEIAELLHLARRTVETHLTSTYRKLGIRRRSQLPDVLSE
ncbi:LuxR C-terminal-related transcriptional regulator [Streptomyces acidiscabies]|uniref:LuxR C-terminal-related transcriptional regulator n=1 Tax=Streptomyces acidiscabies TaxID=42234 RepID=A0AAP6ELQ9_9ACTN|nr:LuxR family transcriptional regulator [Streptomyces acidiscabies]MBZ3916615.1 AAA family ATPase [Streptomyces acidiscabies]MDX2966890.1 LuxR C-terminal-related transcriptional regulator [Streptomyces acidiscabies]MDX3020293.1 LuxR C-terminal-related transcriptional regulator [Streptomyces acidiscabies]MDX3791717.1 LuxR C-terminal-related transcriptional regulator [Streptomyces acidiscabies]GAV44975.1 putative HTH-type transcriptional [Streptomyces acidiscabies]